MLHTAAKFILSIGSEFSVDQKIETPVLAERQVRLFCIHLLSILQQFDFDFWWVES